MNSWIEGFQIVINVKKEDVLLSDEPIELFEEWPAAILYLKNGLFWHGSTTRAYLVELHSIGFESLEEAERLFNSAGEIEKLYYFVNTSLINNSIQIKEFVVRNTFCAVRVRCFYSNNDPDLIVCRLVLRNISKISNNFESANKEMALRNLLEFYDHVNLVDVNEKYIKRIFTKNNEFWLDTNGDAHVYLREFARRYIHPDEADEYIANNQPEHIKEQLQKDGKNFIVSYYQVRNVRGQYIWKAFIILKLLDGREGLYLSYMRDIDAITEHVLIRHDYIRLFNEMPLAYSVVQVDLDEAESIRDIKCLFMSSRASAFMGIDSDAAFGKSVIQNFDVDHLPIKQAIYEAAYKGIRSKRIYYSQKTKSWINVVADKAAQKGQCALIFEDVTKEKMTTERLGIESRTDDLIISCTKLLHSGLPFQVAMESLLKKVGEAIEASRIYVIEKIDEDCYTETFEWCNSGVSSAKDRFVNMTSDGMINWEKEYPGAFNIIIDDIETVKKEHPDIYKKLSDFEVKSFIEMPIMDDGQCIGYFGAVNQPVSKIIDTKALLETVSYFLSSEFSRRRLMEELEKKSIYDELCGVKNRSAMEIAIKKIKKKDSSVGVMFADANGLKVVNDTLGHEAGDELLKKICVIMKRRFNREYVYRAGGDEFVILIQDISEEDFIDNCQRLKEDFGLEEGLAVAIGWCWGADSSEIDTILKNADRLMYEDKANYYRKNNRRRAID